METKDIKVTQFETGSSWEGVKVYAIMHDDKINHYELRHTELVPNLLHSGRYAEVEVGRPFVINEQNVHSILKLCTLYIEKKIKDRKQTPIEELLGK